MPNIEEAFTIGVRGHILLVVYFCLYPKLGDPEANKQKEKKVIRVKYSKIKELIQKWK